MMRFNQMHQLVKPDTQSWFAAASPVASENINLLCVRMNPNGRLIRVPERNGEKPQHA